MDLEAKDAYIAEHLMKLEPDTLRSMVADLAAELERFQKEYVHQDLLLSEQDTVAALRSQLSIVEGEKERLRAENCIRQEMSFQAERRLKRLADDALGALAGAVCTPEEGYILAPQCLTANIRELRNMAEKAKSGLIEATRLQKKSEMLLESSERLRAGMEAEIIQVKGERDRYAKDIAIQFFYHWYNSPGNNTEQGYDAWVAARAAPRSHRRA